MIKESLKNNLHVYFWIMRRHLKVISGSLLDNLINSLVVTGVSSLTFGYLMPIFGINPALNGPLFLGTLVFLNITITDIQSMQIAHDLFTKKFTYYLLTLPASKKWIIGAQITSLMIEMVFLTFPIVFFAKLILGDKLPIHLMHLPYLLILYFLGILYIATLSQAIIFGCSFTWLIKNVFPRIYLPLLFLGCVDTPLNMVQKFFPSLKYLFYISPITYLIEGWRSVLLGTYSIPLYICMIVISGWIIINIIIIKYMLKKKHDLF